MGSYSILSSHASFVLAYPFFVLLVSQLLVGSAGESLFQRCSPFYPKCGEWNISYPFSNDTKVECGLGIIHCVNNSMLQLNNSEDDHPNRFEVKRIHYDESAIVIHDLKFTNLIQANRCNELYNFIIPPISDHLSFHLIDAINLTFLICKGDPPDKEDGDNGLWGYRKCGDNYLHFFPSDLAKPPSSAGDPLQGCKMVEFPMDISGEVNGPLLNRLSGGVRLRWNFPQPCRQCEERGRYCLSEEKQGQLFCADPNDGVKSNKSIYQRKKKAMVITGTAVIVSGSIFAIILMATLVCYSRRKRRKLSLDGNTKNVEAFLRDYGSLAPRRFGHSDIKKMTNSFKEKLGEGGYGGVFKGKLSDGRLVAVKVLNQSKGNGEEFINEVASISRTSHVNIVTLLGFCFDGSKRALIYEFMSNGSLEKFIYIKKSTKSCPHLGWERLHQIAIGIGRGLEYLHRGCNTRILHFDIKPHNILLDEGFCPKISDFGLAKLCPRKDSVISMADARGTIGYIAPEVFYRNLGGVSHKSDVYSYGMMVLEMVGGRKNVDAGVDHTSEIYFPHWIYKHVVEGEHLQLDMVIREEEEEIMRKMVLVGLWCTQVDPANRPSMCRVVDMLQGDLESLPMPPKPFPSSPPPPPPR